MVWIEMRYSFRTSGKTTKVLAFLLVLCSCFCYAVVSASSKEPTSSSSSLSGNGSATDGNSSTVIVWTIEEKETVTTSTTSNTKSSQDVTSNDSSVHNLVSQNSSLIDQTSSLSTTTDSSSQSTSSASDSASVVSTSSVSPASSTSPSISSEKTNETSASQNATISPTVTLNTSLALNPSKIIISESELVALAQNTSKFVLKYVTKDNQNETGVPKQYGKFSFKEFADGAGNYTNFVAKFLTKNVTTKANQFSDFMPDYIRNHGGIVLHLFLLAYVCLSLGIICDLYFLTSIEYIGNTLNLPADIAGATFMALGTSAPELFIALIGVFIAEDDIGTSTILGSAVFNLIFVPSVCAYAIYFSGMKYPKINKYSILRDAIFYMIAITTLLLALKDNEIDWIESVCMMAMYCIYVLILYLNAQLGEVVFEDDESSDDDGISQSGSSGSAESEITPLLQSQNLEKHLLSRSDKYLNFTKSVDWMETGRIRGGSIHTMPMSRTNSIRTSSIRNGSNMNISNVYQPIDNDAAKCALKSHKPLPLLPKPSPDEEPSGMPENWAESNLFLRILMFPLILLIKLTVPKPNKYNYFLTFIISILWISGFTYLSVWLVTIIGNTLGLPSSVLGLTILAAGASIPEVIASVIVMKRAGLANMALCNLFGSNIFDILMCLGLPWLIKSIIQMFRAGSTELVMSIVPVQSNGLLMTTFILLVCVVSFVLTLAYNRWKFGLAVGVTCSIIYFTAISIATTCEVLLN